MTDDLRSGLERDLSATPDRIDDDDLVYDGLKEKPKSPTALDLDLWSMRRGREYAESDLAKAKLPYGMAEERESLAADMLAAAWDPCPQLAEDTTVPRRKRFMELMMQTPEYKALHRQTRLDSVASELAATSFAQQYVAVLAEEETGDELDDEANTLGNIGAALGKASKEVGDLQDMRDALGGDRGGAGPSQGGSMSVDQVRKMFKQVRDNNLLRKIMEKSGRYLRLAQSLQLNKPTHGCDEIVGFELDDDLTTMLSQELALLDDEDLELDFLRRYVDSALLCRDMEEQEGEARGPIVLVVDESGSMNGRRVEHAKAMALAILWVAEHQKRWACLVGFSGDAEGNFLVVEPGKRDMDALMNWLSHFYGGGTCMDVPLDVLPIKWEELGCPAGRTDIIQITDAFVDCDPGMAEHFNNWKRANQVKMTTIVIGCGDGKNGIGDLGQVSDDWFAMNDLNADTEAVHSVLSI